VILYIIFTPYTSIFTGSPTLPPSFASQVSRSQFSNVQSVLTPPLFMLQGLSSQQLRDQEDDNTGLAGHRVVDDQCCPTEAAYRDGIVVPVLHAAYDLGYCLLSSAGKHKESRAVSLRSAEADATVDRRTYNTVCFLSGTN
jgi:hypothetical protein